jgi:hypothetical protein
MDFDAIIGRIGVFFKAAPVYRWIELWIHDTYSQYPTELYISVAVAVLFFILYQLTSSTIHSPRLDFPIVGDPKASDFRSALEEGAKLVYILHSKFLDLKR